MIEIDFGGTPVYVIPRGRGVTVMQGRSYLNLTEPEIDALIDALRPGPRIQKFVNGVEQRGVSPAKARFAECAGRARPVFLHQRGARQCLAHPTLANRARERRDYAPR